jgi:hypothetical protein
MSPVPEKPGIGTAVTLNVNVGAADAEADRPRTARPRTARAVDVLRKLAVVMVSLPFRSIERRHVHKRPAVAKRIQRRPFAVGVGSSIDLVY